PASPEGEEEETDGASSERDESADAGATLDGTAGEREAVPVDGTGPAVDEPAEDVGRAEEAARAGEIEGTEGPGSPEDPRSPEEAPRPGDAAAPQDAAASEDATPSAAAGSPEGAEPGEGSEEAGPTDPSADAAPDESASRPDESASPKKAATGDEPARKGDGGEGSPQVETATLAALYVRQGLVDRAIGMYERLLARDPYNARLAAALDDARGRAREKGSSEARARPDADSTPDRTPARARGGGGAGTEPRPPEARIPKDENAVEAATTIRTALGRVLEGRARPDASDGATTRWPRWLRELGRRAD
ncbi:MAG: hypothetical protein R3266_08515, partial [Gemmatimonadota bacterium]|nr:hypothetical protein [Gemmatimonadota bacterium]